MTDSFRVSLVLLRENILIFGIVFVIGILSLPFTAPQVLLGFSFVRMVDIWLFYIIFLLIMPYFAGGILGMVKEAHEGKNIDFETFKIEGRRHYLHLLIAYVAYINFFFILFAVVIRFAFFIAGTQILAKRGIWLGKHGIMFLRLSMATSTLIAIPLLYFFQFFDLGIVIDGYGVVKSFKESFRFVWARKVSVLGFTLLLLLLMFPMMLPGFLLSLATRSAWRPFLIRARTSQAVLYIISKVFLSAIIGAVIYSYRTIYYIQAKSD